jgi:mRNA-degrading endonuclease YafQ of YafQ-DinJ toxin-antitoxin module
MIELIWDKGFKLTYKKWERKHPELRDQFMDKIKLFTSDPFHSSLKTHQLSGKLRGLWSISITYEERLTFEFVDKAMKKVLLVNIGKHKDVY